MTLHSAPLPALVLAAQHMSGIIRQHQLNQSNMTADRQAEPEFSESAVYHVVKVRLKRYFYDEGYPPFACADLSCLCNHHTIFLTNIVYIYCLVTIYILQLGAWIFNVAFSILLEMLNIFMFILGVYQKHQ